MTTPTAVTMRTGKYTSAESAMIDQLSAQRM
jgi:hypothetical protein